MVEFGVPVSAALRFSLPPHLARRYALQEVLADRVAIRHYGIEAFRDGLTHVIRRSLLFEKVANDEIQEALGRQRFLANLYSFAIPSDPLRW